MATGEHHTFLVEPHSLNLRFGSQAPGEAEAELAYLNRLGVIDAILSDDVDTFLFGARVVVRKYVYTSVSLSAIIEGDF
jgi:5'-3' exonuclease